MNAHRQRRFTYVQDDPDTAPQLRMLVRGEMIQGVALPERKFIAHCVNSGDDNPYEIDAIRRYFRRDGNALRPMLMINEDVLAGNPDNQARDIALGMRSPSARDISALRWLKISWKWVFQLWWWKWPAMSVTIWRKKA